MCNKLQRTQVFIYSTFLNLILLAGLCGNAAVIYTQYWILHGVYFRFTNLIMVGQSTEFIVAPLIWFMVGGGSDSCSEYGNFVLVMPLMGCLLLVCYAWGRHYANKLDYARTVEKLL